MPVQHLLEVAFLRHESVDALAEASTARVEIRSQRMLDFGQQRLSMVRQRGVQGRKQMLRFLAQSSHIELSADLAQGDGIDEVDVP